MPQSVMDEDPIPKTNRLATTASYQPGPEQDKTRQDRPSVISLLLLSMEKPGLQFS